MSLSLLIRRVYGRWPALGPVLYVATIQFFAVQLAVVLRFSPSYSFMIIPFRPARRVAS